MAIYVLRFTFYAWNISGLPLTPRIHVDPVLFTVPFLRRFRSVKALIVSLAAQAVGFALICLTRSIYALLFGWTLITLGIIPGAITNTISANLWPDNPRRGVVLLHGFNGLGKLVGPLIAAVCLMLGWRCWVAYGSDIGGLPRFPTQV